MAKSGEDILTKNNPEQHPPGDNDPKVLTVFETFASKNRRRRALRGLTEVCQIAAMNPWNDTVIHLRRIYFSKHLCPCFGL